MKSPGVENMPRPAVTLPTIIYFKIDYPWHPICLPDCREHFPSENRLLVFPCTQRVHSMGALAAAGRACYQIPVTGKAACRQIHNLSYGKGSVGILESSYRGRTRRQVSFPPGWKG